MYERRAPAACAVSGLFGLLLFEPFSADVMVAAVRFIPFAEGRFECLSGLTKDPVLRQMRPLPEASKQVTHEDLPSHLPHEFIRGDAAPEGGASLSSQAISTHSVRQYSRDPLPNHIHLSSLH